MPLSSKYEIKEEFDEKDQKLTLKIKDRGMNGNYFSEYINDLVAVVGDNGSGKSSLLKLLNRILTDGMGDTADDIKYVLVYAERQSSKIQLSYKENGIKLEIKSNLCINKEGNPRIDFIGEFYKCDFLIYYSPFFNVSNLSHGDVFGSCDISTEYVINSYAEKLHIPKAGDERFFDRLESYSIYEQQIELNFVGDFLEYGEKLPMDLPAYTYIKNNSYAIILLKKELNKMGDNKLLEIIKNFENNIRSLRDKIYLSVFACSCRALNFSLLNNADENISVYEILERINPGITNELKQIINLVEKNIKQLLLGECCFLPIKQRKEEIKQIMSLHYSIKNKYLLLTPFLLFERQRLSTGEDNFIQFFARFYNIWKDAYSYKDQKRDFLESKDLNIVFLIDEGEANFHPEWQRRYLKTLIEWIELIMEKLKKDDKIKHIPKFQILLSTHSPFVACDLPKNNMVCLKLKEKKNTDYFKSVNVCDISEKENIGIGANIIDLLKDGFFIDSTVGAFATKKIEEIVKEIRENGYKNISDESEFGFVLKNLGDKLIKSFLEKSNVK
jgi:energy-coupling factor transporter ATP-binding protein EcfA2